MGYDKNCESKWTPLLSVWTGYDLGVPNFPMCRVV